MSPRGQNPYCGELGSTMRNGLGYHSTGVLEDAAGEEQAKSPQKNTNKIQTKPRAITYRALTGCPALAWIIPNSPNNPPEKRNFLK